MGDGTEELMVVATGAGYELLASDDETLFLLRCKVDHLSARLEGEDATRFRADYETIKQQYPSWEADQTLAQLWDQGGYSWLAVEETS
jgi:hypothetical protein